MHYCYFTKNSGTYLTLIKNYVNKPFLCRKKIIRTTNKQNGKIYKA